MDDTFSNRSLGGKETAPSRQTRTEGREKTVDFNDVIVGFYRMYDLRDYIEAYVKFIRCVKWHVFSKPVTYLVRVSTFKDVYLT